jgi:hypothetical protein
MVGTARSLGDRGSSTTTKNYFMEPASPDCSAFPFARGILSLEIPELAKFSNEIWCGIIEIAMMIADSRIKTILYKLMRPTVPTGCTMNATSKT